LNMSDQKRQWWLYILKLEHDKWYVGITSKSPEDRFREHVVGKRAAYWTMRHKPLEIERVEDLGIVRKKHAEMYENKITRSLMNERGLNSVRGGDLRDVDEYIVRFGYAYIKEQWYGITLVVSLLMVIIYLLIDKYFL
jgi:predicted GIY-YIG superfamily endonuclease